MVANWQGTSGGSYGDAWKMWHTGADEVEKALAIMADLLGQAGKTFASQEQANAAEVDMSWTARDQTAVPSWQTAAHRLAPAACRRVSPMTITGSWAPASRSRPACPGRFASDR